MRKILFLSISFIITLNLTIKAQHIDYNNIDYTYLEQLIKIGIDSLRHEKKLNSLTNDSILYLASKDHAAYFLKNGYTGHFQNDNPEKKTPHQRIQFYGGDYLMTAENVAKSFLFVPLRSSVHTGSTIEVNDYKDAALEFVQGWRDSKGHYKNIITPDFNITGVAVSYDPKTQALYAVQTFGKAKGILLSNNDSRPMYRADTTRKTYSAPKAHKRHAWKIKSGEKLKDHDRYSKQKSKYLKNIKLFNSRDSVILSFVSLNKCHLFFKNKKDGLALEFVSFHDYINDSIYYSKPSIRNNACIFNGIVRQPLYKEQLDELKQQQRRERKSKNLVVHFGKVPENIPEGPYEVNLLILEKNRIRERIKFNHLHGDFLFYEAEADTIPYSYQVKKANIKYKPDYDTIIHKIFFDRNKTTIDAANKLSILSKLDFENYNPYYGIITAYASVEGPEGHNKNLYEQRAQNLIKLIKKEHSDTFPLFVHTRENWKLFKRQIQDTKYGFLADTTEEFAKKFLNMGQALKDLDQKLDKQRYVNLYLIMEEILTEEKTIQYAKNEYNDLYNRIHTKIYKGAQYISNNDSKRLSKLQNYFFNKNLEGKIDLSYISTLPTYFLYPKNYPEKNIFHQLEINQMKFLLEYDPNLTLEKKYKYLGKLAKLKEADPYTTINYFILTIDRRFRSQITEYDKIDLDFIKLLKKTLNNIESKDSLDSYYELSLFYHVSNLLLRYIENPYDDFSKYKRSIAYVYRHFNDSTLSEEIRFKAAKFLYLLDAHSLSLDLLKNIYDEGTENKDIIKYYLILLYSQEEHYTSEYFEFLFDAADIFNQEEWCKLFTDNIRINFQILDYEMIRDFYCKQCGCE